MSKFNRLGLLSLLVATTACTAQEPPQTVVGAIRQASFPQAVVEVVAVGNSSRVTATVASDGAFALTLPAGERYRLELVSASQRATVVFPRRDGAIDNTMFIASGVATLDLGGLRYVEAPGSATYSFEREGCVDGVTPEGALCVDDGTGDTGGTGGEGDTGGAGGEGDTGGTGGEGDTGTGGGQDTGAGGGQDTGASCGAEVPAPEGDSGTSGGSAVPETTPADSIGCDTGEGGGQDTGSGGQDTGSGGTESGASGGQDSGSGQGA